MAPCQPLSHPVATPGASRNLLLSKVREYRRGGAGRPPLMRPLSYRTSRYSRTHPETLSDLSENVGSAGVETSLLPDLSENQGSSYRTTRRSPRMLGAGEWPSYRTARERTGVLPDLSENPWPNARGGDLLSDGGSGG